MNKFRTHNCGELKKTHNNNEVILSGWINKKRDHGNLLFIDLRDNYGITQCVIEKNNKYLIINSIDPISSGNFSLPDLKSRIKNCIFAKIDKPDDNMIFALILKHFSDRQIKIEKKIIEYITKRIERSYGKILDFIYKVDQFSLINKKPIDYKVIKKILEE